MEPAGADDVELARRLILADHDRAAAEAAILLFEPVERVALAGGQADIMAESLSETGSAQIVLVPRDASD